MEGPPPINKLGLISMRSTLISETGGGFPLWCPFQPTLNTHENAGGCLFCKEVLPLARAREDCGTASAHDHAGRLWDPLRPSFNGSALLAQPWQAADFGVRARRKKKGGKTSESHDMVLFEDSILIIVKLCL